MKKLFFALFALFSLNTFSQRLDISYQDIWFDNKWDDLGVFKSYYGSSGNLDSILSFSVGDSAPYDKLFNTYTLSGRIASTLNIRYNTSRQRWENRKKIAYTYDEVNFSEIELTESFNNGNWVNERRVVRKFDFDSRLLSETIEEWEQNTWRFTKKTEYYYKSPNLKGLFNFVWNQINNSWDTVSEKKDFLKPGVGILESNLLIKNNSVWTNTERTVFGYNTNGFVDTVIIFQNDSSNWKFKDRNYYTYGPNGLEAITYQNYWGFQGEWGNWMRRRYEFNQALSHNSRINNSIIVFPNPANKWVKIKLEEDKNSIEIYDLKGDLVLNDFSDKGEKELDISKLSSGLYLLRIQNASGILSHKLLVK